MEKDFEIEVEEQSVEETGVVQLPMNILEMGHIENDDVKVYIHQKVYSALEKFSSSNVSRELGSILIGHGQIELGKMNVVISQYIEAKYTDASAATLTFTHETWDYVHTEHAKNYPNEKIVGWQHTHPGYGIFLSNYDLFIQENFFNLPFQVAYVIDPVQNLKGFFQWKNGRIEKLNGYYIYDEVGKQISIERPKKKRSKRTKRYLTVIAMLFAALCVAIALLIGTVCKVNRIAEAYQQEVDINDKITQEINECYEKLAAQEEKLISQEKVISMQEESLLKQEEFDAALQEFMKEDATKQERFNSANKLIEAMKCDNEETVEEEKLITLLEEYLSDDAVDGKSVDFIMYTVAEGDNLTKICMNNGLDYESMCSVVMALNGIENADMIYVGEMLLIPIMK